MHTTRADAIWLFLFMKLPTIDSIVPIEVAARDHSMLFKSNRKYVASIIATTQPVNTPFSIPLPYSIIPDSTHADSI